MFLRTFTVHFIKAFANEMPFNIGIQWAGGSTEKDSAHPEHTGFVLIDPVPESLVVVNDVAQRNDVVPVRVFGYWYRARNEKGKHDQPAKDGERAIYFLHGASYCYLYELRFNFSHLQGERIL